MKLLKDQEYFCDIDRNGNLKKDVFPKMTAADYTFLTTVLQEKREPVSFKVRAQGVTKIHAEASLYSKLLENVQNLEKSTWKKCIKEVMKGPRNYIGSFPDKSYRVRVLHSEDGEEYPVVLDCPKQIQEHKNGALTALWDIKENLRKADRNRRNLRMAAFFAVITLLLNAITALSHFPGYAHLYFGNANPTAWAGFVTAIQMMAFVNHRSKIRVPHMGLIVAACTFEFQREVPVLYEGALPSLEEFIKNLNPESIIIVGAITTVIFSLIYSIRYIKHACKAPSTQENWKHWVSQVEDSAEDIHRELRFLTLWYRHMTGETLFSLGEQEKKLSKCVACAKRRRR